MNLSQFNIWNAPPPSVGSTGVAWTAKPEACLSPTTDCKQLGLCGSLHQQCIDVKVLQYSKGQCEPPCEWHPGG